MSADGLRAELRRASPKPRVAGSAGISRRAVAGSHRSDLGQEGWAAPGLRHQSRWNARTPHTRVTCPSPPGLVTYGETLEQARAMAADAIEGYLECLEEDGLRDRL